MTIVAAVLALLTQDQIENPEYKGWASFKPGSSVTYRMTVGGAAQPGTQKLTLKSVNENEVVVEMELTREGKPAGAPRERKVAAKISAGQTKTAQEGEEEIELGGKKLKCRWKLFEKTLGNSKAVTQKVWFHDDIPGMAAQVEISMPEARSTMTAAEWEKK